jgi:hypothetical protein
MWVIPIGWRYSKARVTPAATGTGWPGAQIPFQCVAASIGQATAHWLTSGPLVPAVMASCAVPAASYPFSGYPERTRLTPRTQPLFPSAGATARSG